MTDHDRALRDLMRRVDEVRGLAQRAETGAVLEADDPESLARILEELVEELERSHRRLIETNVQLVSLREVASTMVNTLDTGETTRTITRYLSRAFDFEDAFVLLLDADRAVLSGTWTHRSGEREQSYRLDVPLVGDPGAVPRTLWLNRTVRLHDLTRHPALTLPHGHPLDDVLTGLGTLISVPLQRSHSVLPSAEAHELCGVRCVLGDATVMAPPPGPAAESWALEREERQRHCLGCELLPLLGVIGTARTRGRPALGPGDVTLIESIALSVAPMVENARLYHELRRSERFRIHVLDSMASALVAVNLGGEVLTFNRAAQELLGWSEEEVTGRPFGSLFGTDADELMRATVEHGREASREEVMLRSRDGTPVPVSLTTSLLRDERRTVYGAIATFVDLTPLKRAEDHARSQDRLAALGRFTSSVAHEIRNPLTGIGAGVQYLARSLANNGPDSDPQAKSVEFILNEIRRLDRIVQDLFDITHPRALQRRTAPLEAIARRAVQSLAAALSERDVSVAVTVAPGTPPVPHDPDSIQQVFINLIKNAAEASPAGGTVEVAIGPASHGRPGRAHAAQGVIARVADRGPGIASEHLATLFEPFFTTKPGGTGLGLYICHDIVKRHGGALTVQSEPGSGSVFTLELPFDAEGGTT
jgi:two-component system nitrogen regulation sensor histidine kinase GlnL